MQQASVAPDVKVKIREFGARILEAESRVLQNPSEENLTRLTDVLEESRRFREGLKGG